MSKTPWVNSAAEICVSKDGKSRFIKVKKNFKALKDNNLVVVPFKEHLEGLQRAGYMDEEKVKDTLTRITWVKYVINAPPQEFKTEDNAKTKNGWLNNALEIRTTKEDRKLFIKVRHDFEANEGQNIPLTKFEDHINFLFESKRISEEEKEKQMQVSDFVHYLGSIPPKK